MDETKVVNCRHESYDIYIGRGYNGENMNTPNINVGERGWLGNPYRLGVHGDRNEVIKKFKNDFVNKMINDADFRKSVFELKGKRLGCFCKPKSCHGDVIAEFLDDFLD